MCIWYAPRSPAEQLTKLTQVRAAGQGARLRIGSREESSALSWAWQATGGSNYNSILRFELSMSKCIGFDISYANIEEF